MCGWRTSAAVLAATLASASTAGERSAVVYPPQELPLAFEHSRHAARGIGCDACHAAARTSRRSSDRLLPGTAERPHAGCDQCHEIAAGERGVPCRQCHPGFDESARRRPAAVVMPIPNLRFDHRAHTDRQIECSICHGDVGVVGLATRAQLPEMRTCLACHDGLRAPSRCATCHLAEPSGRLLVRLGSGVLRPGAGDPLGLDHGAQYELSHGAQASRAPAWCGECHAERDCQSCHDALRKPLRVHPNDYLTVHPVQARAGSSRCESCHRAQSFCAACHERAGVGPDADRSLRPTNLKVHPSYAEWVELPGPRHHAVFASREIGECASCHREESCTRCHSVAAKPGGRGLNPHPSGFAQSCGAMARSNDRACLKCHQPGDLERRGCR
ncbi:MAG: cytochrome c3 family protein [Myxococcales bacterium]|nr:cytochrome c3 family protein [Myxococcales bacterium]